MKERMPVPNSSEPKKDLNQPMEVQIYIRPSDIIDQMRVSETVVNDVMTVLMKYGMLNIEGAVVWEYINNRVEG